MSEEATGESSLGVEKLTIQADKPNEIVKSKN